MSTIKIDKGIPLPTAKSSAAAAGSSKYPFRTMEVGDSFFLPGTENRHALSSAMAITSKRYPDLILASRKAVENGVVGIRVWRLEAPLKIAAE